jgi:hypothetical protein
MSENDNAPGAVAADEAGGGGEAVSGETVGGEAAGGEAAGGESGGEAAAAAAVPAEEITYHAVEKDGQVTAIWEMQGRKHLRTIDPRSRQGQEILRLYTAEHEQQ